MSGSKPAMSCSTPSVALPPRVWAAAESASPISSSVARIAVRKAPGRPPAIGMCNPLPLAPARCPVRVLGAQRYTQSPAATTPFLGNDPISGISGPPSYPVGSGKTSVGGIALHAAASLDRFFAPQSIVVIGASPERRKIRGLLLYLLRKNGYPGRLYAVNPSYRDIDGVPCHAALADIGEPIDLALVAIPAERVL